MRNIFKVFKEKLFFKNEGKIKTFPDKQTNKKRSKNLLLVHVPYKKY